MSPQYSEGRFALVIEEVRIPDAGPARYSMFVENQEVSEEAVLSLVRLWLKDSEDKLRANLR
jgi:hypothetical protein